MIVGTIRLLGLPEELQFTGMRYGVDGVPERAKQAVKGARM